MRLWIAAAGIPILLLLSIGLADDAEARHIACGGNGTYGDIDVMIAIDSSGSMMSQGGTYKFIERANMITNEIIDQLEDHPFRVRAAIYYGNGNAADTSRVMTDDLAGLTTTGSPWGNGGPDSYTRLRSPVDTALAGGNPHDVIVLMSDANFGFASSSDVPDAGQVFAVDIAGSSGDSSVLASGATDASHALTLVESSGIPAETSRIASTIVDRIWQSDPHLELFGPSKTREPDTPAGGGIVSKDVKVHAGLRCIPEGATYDVRVYTVSGTASSSGSAGNGKDFNHLDSLRTGITHESTFQTFKVRILSDYEVEGTEYLDVKALFRWTGGSWSPQETHRISITSEDTWGVGPWLLHECLPTNPTRTFTVYRPDARFSQTVGVYFASGTADVGLDVQSYQGSVTFQAGSNTATFQADVICTQADDEDIEVFEVRLTTAVPGFGSPFHISEIQIEDGPDCYGTDSAYVDPPDLASQYISVASDPAGIRLQWEPLEWDPLTWLLQCPVTSYHVVKYEQVDWFGTPRWKDVVSGTYWDAGSPYRYFGGDDRVWIDEDVKPCTRYRYQMAPHNDVKYSRETPMDITVPPEPPAPVPSGTIGSSMGTVSLQWQASPEHGCPIEGYRVERLLPGATEYETIALTGPNEFGLADSPGTGCPTVTYRVTAFNEYGNADPYTWPAHKVLDLPGTPVSVTASYGGGSAGNKQVHVSWANGGSCPVTSYTVTADHDGTYNAPAGPGGTVPGSATSFTGTLTGTCVQYRWTVSATNSVGTSPQSGSAALWGPKAVPPGPTDNFQVDWTDMQAGTAGLSWDYGLQGDHDCWPSSYDVHRSQDPGMAGKAYLGSGAADPSDKTSWTFTDPGRLTSCDTYHYQVTPRNSLGTGSQSAILQLDTPLGPPGPTKDEQATWGGMVLVTWDQEAWSKCPDPSFRVYRDPWGSAGGPTLIASGVQEMQYLDTDLLDLCAGYDYRIQPENAWGIGQMGDPFAYYHDPAGACALADCLQSSPTSPGTCEEEACAVVNQPATCLTNPCDPTTDPDACQDEACAAAGQPADCPWGSLPCQPNCLVLPDSCLVSDPTSCVPPDCIDPAQPLGPSDVVECLGRICENVSPGMCSFNKIHCDIDSVTATVTGLQPACDDLSLYEVCYRVTPGPPALAMTGCLTTTPAFGTPGCAFQAGTGGQFGAAAACMYGFSAAMLNCTSVSTGGVASCTEQAVRTWIADP